MLEHGVYKEEFMTSTEVQKQNTARVQIREAIPPNHASPGHSIIVHMGIEAHQENSRISASLGPQPEKAR